MINGISVDGWLDRKAAAHYLGLTEYWLEKHYNSSDAPPYVKHGRKTWYRQTDLDKWRSEQPTLEGLDALFTHAKRRRPDPPPAAAELESKYVAEHGAPDKSPAYARLRHAFVQTLSYRQRKLFTKLETC